MKRIVFGLFALAGVCVPAVAWSEMVQLRVHVENLAPAGSVAISPLTVGFGAGMFDPFDAGKMAGESIVKIAEGGDGSMWRTAFQAAEPAATVGVVTPGPLTPGGTAMADFMVDSSMNRYFSFGAMVVPSNDYFVGNDMPMQYPVFDAGGQLALTSITLKGSDIWNAGSEMTDAMHAAFLQVGMNDLRTPENGMIGADFADLNTFNGLTTAAGYAFNSQLTADLDVYRISFEVVPEPSSTALMSLVGVASCVLLRRGLRRTSARQ
jgi:hypothetical protein